MQQNALTVSRGVTVQVLQQPPAISQSGTVAQTSRSTPEVSLLASLTTCPGMTQWTLCYIFYRQHSSHSTTSRRQEKEEELELIVKDLMRMDFKLFQWHNYTINSCTVILITFSNMSKYFSSVHYIHPDLKYHHQTTVAGISVAQNSSFLSLLPY